MQKYIKKIYEHTKAAIESWTAEDKSSIRRINNQPTRQNSRARALSDERFLFAFFRAASKYTVVYQILTELQLH